MYAISCKICDKVYINSDDANHCETKCKEYIDGLSIFRRYLYFITRSLMRLFLKVYLHYFFKKEFLMEGLKSTFKRWL